MPCIFHWFGNKIHGTYTFWLLWSNFKFWRYLKKASCLFIYCTDLSRRPAHMQDYRCNTCKAGKISDSWLPMRSWITMTGLSISIASLIPVFWDHKKAKINVYFLIYLRACYKDTKRVPAVENYNSKLGIFSAKITSAVNKYGELSS